MSVARVQTTDRNINQIQSNILSQLNPLLDNVLVNGLLLTSIALTSGSNTIKHTLNRALQGWFIVRKRSTGNIYDTQDSNTNPSTTLILVSDASVTVDLYVF